MKFTIIYNKKTYNCRFEKNKNNSGKIWIENNKQSETTYCQTENLTKGNNFLYYINTDVNKRCILIINENNIQYINNYSNPQLINIEKILIENLFEYIYDIIIKIRKIKTIKTTNTIVSESNKAFVLESNIALALSPILKENVEDITDDVIGLMELLIKFNILEKYIKIIDKITKEKEKIFIYLKK